MDNIALKNYIVERRDRLIRDYGKFNIRADELQRLLKEMNSMDSTVVTADDLVCEGLGD